MQNRTKLLLSICVLVFLSAYLPALADISDSKAFDIVLQRTDETSDSRKFAIAFSPDNTAVALGGMNMDIWSTKGYLIRNVLPQSSTYAFSLFAFSKDGSELATTGRNGITIIIYNARTGKPARTINLAGKGGTSCLAFSADGKTLAIGTNSGEIEFWDYKTPRLIKQLQASEKCIAQLAFLDKGRLLCGIVDRYKITRTATYTSQTPNNGLVGFEIAILDSTGRKEKTFKWKNDASGQAFSLAPGSEMIAVHGTTTAWLLDQNFTVVKTTSVSYRNGPILPISRMFYSPNGREIAIITSPPPNDKYNSYRTCKMIILSAKDLSKIADYDLGESEIMDAVYAPNSKTIGIAGMHGETNRLIDPHTGALNLILNKTAGTPFTAAISPDGKHIASGGSPVSIWQIDGGDPKTVKSNFHTTKIIFSPDKRHIIIARRYGVEITEIDSGETRLIPSSQLSPLALSRDGKLIAYMPPTGTNLAVMDVDSGKIRNVVPVNYSPVARIAFDASGRFLVWGKGIYDLQLNKLVATLFGGHSMDASRTLVAVTGDRASIEIFDLQGHRLKGLPIECAAQELSFTPDEKTLIVGTSCGDIELRKMPEGTLIKKLVGHTAGIIDLETSSNGKFLVSTSLDHTIKVWNLKNYAHYTRFSSADEWLIYTQDGYFDASPHGGSLAAMVSGLDVYGMEQFAARNNRPDIILSRMGLGTPEQVSHYRSRFQKRLKKLGLTEADLSSKPHAPEADITSATRDGKYLILDFTLHESKFALKSYNIYVNNVPLFPDSGKDISTSKFSGTEKIELGEGRNKIEVSAINTAGAESFRAQAYADFNGAVKGNLYYLAFGISQYQNPELALDYADKDARDLENSVLTMRAGYDKVYTKVLTNSTATSANIKEAKGFLKDATVDDTVILFAAGHGGYSKETEPQYYYLPYDADPEDLERTGVKFEIIEDLLDGIKPRKKLFLLDTCESGELDETTYSRLYTTAYARGLKPRTYRKPLKKRGANMPTGRSYLLEKNRFIHNDLSRRTGAVVFSSSRGGEISYESSAIRNGFFTKGVIEALTTMKADKNMNHRISLKELQIYVSNSVIDSTGGLQHPTIDRDNLYQEIEFPSPTY